MTLKKEIHRAAIRAALAFTAHAREGLVRLEVHLLDMLYAGTRRRR